EFSVKMQLSKVPSEAAPPPAELFVKVQYCTIPPEAPPPYVAEFRRKSHPVIVPSRLPPPRWKATLLENTQFETVALTDSHHTPAPDSSRKSPSILVAPPLRVKPISE